MNCKHYLNCDLHLTDTRGTTLLLFQFEERYCNGREFYSESGLLPAGKVEDCPHYKSLKRIAELERKVGEFESVVARTRTQGC